MASRRSNPSSKLRVLRAEKFLFPLKIPLAFAVFHGGFGALVVGAGAALGLAGGLSLAMVPVLVCIFLAGAMLVVGLTMSKTAWKKARKAQDPGPRGGAAEGMEAAGAEALCNPQLEDYFSSIKSELTQVDRLAADAAGELVASFKYISQLTRSQQDISLAIAAAAAAAGGEPVGLLLERQAVIADQIEHEVEAAVRSLQFGDLVAQLLNHTMIRVDAIGAALQRVDLVDAGQDGGEASCEAGQFHRGVSRAVMLANGASRRKPVVQHGMQTGEIELF